MFLAHKWPHGEKDVRRRPHVSGGSADGELVRELSREPVSARLINYCITPFTIFAQFFCYFCWCCFLKYFSVSTESTHIIAVLSWYLNLPIISISILLKCFIAGMNHVCKMFGILWILKEHYKYSTKSDHYVKSAREGAYQEECSHCWDLVQFHQQSERFLMVATVLLIHKELVFLQEKALTYWLGEN